MNFESMVMVAKARIVRILRFFAEWVTRNTRPISRKEETLYLFIRVPYKRTMIDIKL